MIFRKATISDYEALHAIRMAVRENILVNTNAVTPEIYREMLEQKGRGWVCEDETGKVAGFSIVDLSNHSVWALFIHPDFEGKGIGRHLHKLMLDWSFKNGSESLWLTTDPGTRAESFYLKAGWQKKGLTPDGELKLEITNSAWLNNSTTSSHS